MDSFKWDDIPRDPRASIPILTYKGCEVARLQQRHPGEWVAILRYPGQEPVWRPCTSFERGKAGVEAWAQRHREAIIADVEASFADFRRRVPGGQRDAD